MPERKSLIPIPKFDSEEEEREFWASHDAADYVGWSRAKPVTFARPLTKTAFPRVLIRRSDVESSS